MPANTQTGPAVSSRRPARSKPRSVLITGASAGLGAALARDYAAPGRVMGLVARRVAPLAEVAAYCTARGANVLAESVDVRDGSAIREFVERLVAMTTDGAIDLVIVNAGLFSGRRAAIEGAEVGTVEPVALAADVLAVNLAAAITTIDTVLPAMRRRRHGHIAIVCSLAAWQPLADAPAYSASKAGLSAYGEALRELLAPEGIRVSLIYPGHIATAQAEAQDGSLPLLVSATQAARRIRRGLERGRATIAFPRRLVWLIRLGRLVPWRLRAYVSRSLRFTVRAPGQDSR